MQPINNLEGIIEQEKLLDGGHVIILMIIKPSDKNAEEYFKNFNYWHYSSREYCSIYLLGYSLDFKKAYKDIKVVEGIENSKFEYSDQCFIEVRDELGKKLKNWKYSGEPELLILQRNSENDKSLLDFSYYNYIDINYGIAKGYLDSFPRFMERLIEACKREVTAVYAVDSASRMRVKPRKVLEFALEACPKLPKPLKAILADRLFYMSYNTKEPESSYTLDDSGAISYEGADL